MARVPHLQAMLLVAALSAAGCATAVDDRFRVEVTGPGGLPKACRLPDCALPAKLASEEEAAFAGIAEILARPDWRIREYASCVFEESSTAIRPRRSSPTSIW